MTRFTPLDFAISPARATEALVPEMTTCPGALSLATTQTGFDSASGAVSTASLETCSASSTSAPRSALIAPSPTGTACCIARPRNFNKRAASASVSAPVAARAVYSPSECPATSLAWRARSSRASCSRMRIIAMLAAMIAGCAFSVSVRSLSGPCHITRDRRCESASSTSSKTALAGVNASANTFPMPIAWLPCPGKMNARVMVTDTNQRPPDKSSGQTTDHESLSNASRFNTEMNFGTQCAPGPFLRDLRVKSLFRPAHAPLLVLEDRVEEVERVRSVLETTYRMQLATKRVAHETNGGIFECTIMRRRRRTRNRETIINSAAVGFGFLQSDDLEHYAAAIVSVQLQGEERLAFLASRLLLIERGEAARRQE